MHSKLLAGSQCPGRGRSAGEELRDPWTSLTSAFLACHGQSDVSHVGAIRRSSNDRQKPGTNSMATK